MLTKFKLKRAFKQLNMPELIIKDLLMKLTLTFNQLHYVLEVLPDRVLLYLDDELDETIIVDDPYLAMSHILTTVFERLEIDS